MAVYREFRVLVATDGSAPAKTAVATAVRFPWPSRTRAQGVTAKQVRRTIEVRFYWRPSMVAPSRRCRRATGPPAPLARCRSDHFDTAPVTGVLKEAKRFEADVICSGGAVTAPCADPDGERLSRGRSKRHVRRPGGQACAARCAPNSDRLRRIRQRAAGSGVRRQAVPTSRRSRHRFHRGRSHGRAIACAGIPRSRRDGCGGGQAHQRERTARAKRNSHGLELPSPAPAGASEPGLPQANR